MSTEKKRNLEETCEISPVSSTAGDETALDGASASSKKVKTIEVLSLNTNISVEESLKWETSRCIRELLLNCADEDLEAYVEKVDERTWKLINKVKAGRPSLQKINFSYHSNGEKVDNRRKNGKFGYGLKDAVVSLTARGIQYVARSVHGSFTAYSDNHEIGNVLMRIDPNGGIADGVEQTLTISNHSTISPEDFAQDFKVAQRQCIAFRVRDEYKSYEAVEVSNDEGDPLGTVYMPPTDSNGEDVFVGATELFVHGCAYPFCEGGDRKPLALVYNLHMDKATLKGRDRIGLPEKWETALRNLIKEAGELVLHRLWKFRKNGDTFYESFSNQKCNDMINKYAKAVEEEERRIVAEAHRAQQAVLTAENMRVEAEREEQAALKRLEEDSATEESVPSVVVQKREATISRLQEATRTARAHFQEVQASSIAKTELARTVTRSAAPTVLVFRSDIYSSEVSPISIKNAQHSPEWAKGDVPWIEEFSLMNKCTPLIDRKHTQLFRQLRRLLYVLGLEDTVDIRHHDASMPSTILVEVRGTTMHVRFGADERDVVYAAILELCSAGLHSGLMGRTPLDAVAQLCNYMLRLTPEEPKDIKNSRPKLMTKFLGELRSFPAVVPFCPLLVATEWDTKMGGISSFNIQLAKGLAMELRLRQKDHGNELPVVYVMVRNLEEPNDAIRAEWDAAAGLGISIIEASCFRGRYTPCLTPSQCSRITHIVGHAHITGSDAAHLRKLPQLQHTKLWQMNHVLPLKVDILKEERTAQERRESARKKEATINALNEEADHVFSVGAMMYDHFEQQLDKVDRDPDTNHTKLILPLNPDFALHPSRKKDFNNVIEVLYFGRTDSGVYFVKGMDIAMRAVERANADSQITSANKKITLKVRGTKAGLEAETMLKLVAMQNASARNIAPSIFGFASPAEILKDLQTTQMVIMPSRNEPFGLVAMEAIACQVPLLVSGNSGVAQLLAENDMERMCVQTCAHHPDVSTPEMMEADVDAWSKAILTLISSGPRAFERAKNLAAKLKNLPSPYSDMIALGDGNAKATSSSTQERL